MVCVGTRLTATVTDIGTNAAGIGGIRRVGIGMTATATAIGRVGIGMTTADMRTILGNLISTTGITLSPTSSRNS